MKLYLSIFFLLLLSGNGLYAQQYSDCPIDSEPKLLATKDFVPIAQTNTILKVQNSVLITDNSESHIVAILTLDDIKRLHIVLIDGRCYIQVDCYINGYDEKVSFYTDDFSVSSDNTAIYNVFNEERSDTLYYIDGVPCNKDEFIQYIDNNRDITGNTVPDPKDIKDSMRLPSCTVSNYNRGIYRPRL